jgi:hypothetical protein
VLIEREWKKGELVDTDTELSVEIGVRTLERLIATDNYCADGRHWRLSVVPHMVHIPLADRIETHICWPDGRLNIFTYDF